MPRNERPSAERILSTSSRRGCQPQRPDERRATCIGPSLNHVDLGFTTSRLEFECLSDNPSGSQPSAFHDHQHVEASPFLAKKLICFDFSFCALSPTVVLNRPLRSSGLCGSIQRR